MADTGQGDFEAEMRVLQEGMAGLSGVAARFSAEVARMGATVDQAGNQVKGLERAMSGGLRHAFDGVVFDGLKLSDALNGLARSVVSSVYGAAVRPVSRHFGGVLAQGVNSVVSGLMPFENGAPFVQGRVTPFARGGIVTSPVAFPMRGGTGLMGEAGPEAIMPLARGSDGKLGVRAAAGGSGGAGAVRPVQVVMNITTPDVAGFRRSQSQIAAQVSRALGVGGRNR